MIRILNAIVVGLYRKNQIGVNCPDEEIIAKESTCKAASVVLGLRFSNIELVQLTFFDAFFAVDFIIFTIII